MPKAPNQKYKLFYILELLRSESDEKHPVTMPQIISYLKQNGIHAERKSVYSDMEALQILGYDVVCQKNPAGYYLGSREFELAELKLLVDAVQASKFITQKQSRNLIEKLEHFTSRHEANRLQRQVCVNDRVKTENLSSLYLIDDIHQAMHENQPVTFVYCEWNQNKELVPRHGGERYLVSPWMLMWEDENYYLLAYDHKAEMIKYFRVDKLRQLKREEGKEKGKQHIKNWMSRIFQKKRLECLPGRKKGFSLFLIIR